MQGLVTFSPAGSAGQGEALTSKDAFPPASLWPSHRIMDIVPELPVCLHGGPFSPKWTQMIETLSNSFLENGENWLDKENAALQRPPLYLDQKAA